MRFKFRVFDKRTGEQHNTSTFSPLRFADEDHDYITIEDPHPDHVIQQFTGQTDENGTDIYEGDLISVNENSCKPPVIYEVKYFPCWCCYYMIKDNARQSMAGVRFSGKVVGHIYEKENTR